MTKSARPSRVKRSHTVGLAIALCLGLAASVDQAASAATSKQAGSPARGAIGRGKIGSALPTPGAAARIRALGLDDGGGEAGSSEDDGGFVLGGRAAHGTIGKAAPTANTAARIAALGLDD
jgi:hypothetical protein